MSVPPSSSPSRQSDRPASAAEPGSGPPRRPGSLPVIFLTVFLDLLGFGMVIPLLAYYTDRYDASPLAITALFSSFSLAQLLFTPLWGRLSDRHGRRPMLLASIGLNVVSYLAFAFAPTYWILFLARTLSGIASSNIGVAQAYIADSTGPEDRAKGMGLIGAAFGLGFVLGPTLGGVLGAIDYRAVPLCAAALAAINFVSAWSRLPETRTPAALEEARRSPFLGSLRRSSAPTRRPTHPAIWGLMTILFLTVTSFSIMEATLPIYLKERLAFDQATTSYFFVYLGVVIVIVQAALIGRLSRRFGEPALIGAGLVLLSVGLLALPASPALRIVLFLAGAALALGSGLINPSIPSALSRLVDEDQFGGTLGLSRSFSALGRVVGPVAGGWLFERMSPEWPYWVAGGLMVLTLLVSIPILTATVRSLRVVRESAAAEPAATESA